MPVTLEQAIEADEFHSNGCTIAFGPRGGTTTRVERWRRSGRTKTWSTRPGEFRIPVKFGMRESTYISHRADFGNAAHFHTAADCPLLKEAPNA